MKALERKGASIVAARRSMRAPNASRIRLTAIVMRVRLTAIVMWVRLIAIVMWVRLIAIVTSRGEEEGAQRKVVQRKVHTGKP